MKRIIVTAHLLALLAAVSACAPKAKPITPRAPQEVAREPTRSAYDEILDELLPGMGADSVVERQKPQQTFEDLCLYAARPGAEDERLALCQAIVKRLGPETPKPARVWMLRQLAHIGGEESIPALAELLGDEDPRIRELSRRALQNIPAPSAGDALRIALDDASDSAWQVALINALAARRDETSVSRFVKLVHADDVAVASAAVAALGDIGTTAAVNELKRVRSKLRPELRSAATHALLRCAARRLAMGNRGGAYLLYRDLYETATSDVERVAGLHGMVRAYGARVVPLLLTFVMGDDPRMAATAARLAEEIPDPAVTPMLVEVFSGASPAAQVLLLRAFAARRDRAAYPTVTAAVGSADEHVRIAALRALRELGGSETVALLARAAAGGAGEEREAARESLNLLRGVDVDEAILAAMQEQTDTAVRCELIKSLAARWCRPAIPALFAASTEPAETIRVAAFDALGELALRDHLTELVQRLVDMEGDEARHAAENAVVKTALRVDDVEQRALPVLAVLNGTGGTVKASLIRVLGRIGGNGVLQAIRAARPAAEAEVVDAAVRALANWPNPEVLDDLLDIARTSTSETHQVLALRGYVRLVRLPSERTPLETFKLLAPAMDLATRTEEKKLVLGALGDVRDINALQMAESLLDDEALRDEAGVTVLAIARSLAAEQAAAAVGAIEKVRAAATSEKVRQQVDEAIGFIERFEGYSAAWVISGPYMEEGKKSADLFDMAFPPELPDAAHVEWTPLAVNNHANPWVFDLARAIGGESRCVYAKTSVWSDKQQEARLEIGSDDGVKAWLNGKLVHSNLAYRVVTPGEDKVAVTLDQGWNTLLLKIVQGGDGWGFCAGFKTPDGNPIEALKFKAE
jgi:HEAT repeat protein